MVCYVSELHAGRDVKRSMKIASSLIKGQMKGAGRNSSRYLNLVNSDRFLQMKSLIAEDNAKSIYRAARVSTLDSDNTNLVLNLSMSNLEKFQ